MGTDAKLLINFYKPVTTDKHDYQISRFFLSPMNFSLTYEDLVHDGSFGL